MNDLAPEAPGDEVIDNMYSENAPIFSGSRADAAVEHKIAPTRLATALRALNYKSGGR